jgi:isoquinoline 1-oxidoreductase beta subunit
MGANFAAWKGATIQYAVPHRRISQQRVALPIPTTWWRGLGLLANKFAVESFFDELASEARVDPLEFRLTHLPNDDQGGRFRRFLKLLLSKVGGESQS